MSDAITPVPPPTDDPGGRYPSLAALRADHSRLLRAYKTEASLAPADRAALLDRIAAFVRRGRDTGAVLGASEDRFTAQGLLTYWSNVLYRAGRPPADTGTDLVEFDTAAAPRLEGMENPFAGIGQWSDAPSPGWARLVDDAVRAVDQHRLVAVLGANGSGRHTLIQNGLLPALRADRLPGSGGWDYLPTVTLGADPLAALAAALAPADAAAWAARLAAAPAAAGAELAATRPRPAVLVVERFGDLLAGGDAALARRVADALLAVVDPGPGHRVVVTVNPARLGPVEGLGRFGRLFRKGQVLVAFSAAELRQMVTDPADRVGLRFDEGVLDRLLMDVQGDPASLALLRFSLKLLWDAREGNRITHEAYDRLGGGRLAVGRKAEEVYGKLDAPAQVAARGLLLRLIRPATGAGVACGRASRGRLLDGLPPAAAAVLERFEAEGLIVPVVRVAGEPPEVAPVHEALATAWPRFLGWLDDVREQQQWRFRLKAAAEQWQAQGRKPGALWSGAVLAVGLETAERVRAEAPFDPLEDDFLAESTRRDNLMRWIGRGGLAAAVVAVVTVSLLAVANYKKQTALALAETAAADEKAAAAEAGEKAQKELTRVSEEGRRAALWTNSGWQLQTGKPDPGGDLAAAYLRYAYAWKSQVDAATDPARPDADPRAFAHLLRLGTVRLQLPALRGMAHTAHRPEDGFPPVAAHAADGRLALTAGVEKAGAGFDLVVRVWRPGAGGRRPADEFRRPHTELAIPPHLLATPPNRVGGVFVGPADGRAVVLLTWDKEGGVVCPFDLPDGGGVVWGKPGAYDGFLGKAELSPDGQHFAVAAYRFDDRKPDKSARVARSTVAVWAAPKWEAVQLRVPDDCAGRIAGLAFEPVRDNPRVVAVFGSDAPAPTPVGLEWPVDGGGAAAPKRYASDRPARTDQPEGEVVAAAYSPGAAATLFVSRSSAAPVGGETAWVFDAARHKVIYRFPPTRDPVTAVAFSPVGNPTPAWTAGKRATARAFALGTAAGGVSFWRLLHQDDELGVKAEWKVEGWSAGPGAGHAQQVFRVGFSPDGQYLVSASRDRRAVVWGVAAGRPLDTTLHHSGSVTDAAFTPDGRGVLTAAAGAAYRWDLPDPAARPLSFAVPGTDLDRTADDHALAADGSAFAAGGERRGYPNPEAAAGADRSVGQTGGRRGWVRVWDPATGAPLTPELLQPKPVARVAVSPRGPLLVCTTGTDGSVRVWDAAAAREPGAAREPVWTEPRCAEKATFAAFGDDGTALRLLVLGREDRDVSAGKTVLRAYTLGPSGQPVGEPLRAEYDNPLTAAVFGPKCERVAAYSGDDGDGRGLVVVWDLSPTLPRPLDDPGPTRPRPLEHPGGQPAHRGSVTHVGFAADGRVVTAGRDDEVVVWTAAGAAWKGEVLGVKPGKDRQGHTADVTYAEFDTGGNRVVSAGWDGNTIVWTREGGGAYQPTLTLRPADRSREVVRAVFAGDRLVAAAGGDGVVRVWDTGTTAGGQAVAGGQVVAAAQFPMPVRHLRWRPGPGAGAVLAVGPDTDTRGPGAGPASGRWTRPWAVRFTAAEFPLTRLAPVPPAGLIHEAEVVAARTASSDQVQLAALSPGEVLARLAPPTPPSPADPRAWLVREAGRCEAAGNWEGALRHLTALLPDAPAGAAAGLLARRAGVLTQLGSFDLAEAEYAKALEGRPPDPDVLRALAQLRFRRADQEAGGPRRKALFGEARDAYLRLHQLDRGDPLDGIRLVESYLEAGDPAAAVVACDRLLEDEYNPEVLFLRAKAYSTDPVSRHELAFADFVRAARAFAGVRGLEANAADAFAKALALSLRLAPRPPGELAEVHADYGGVLLTRGGRNDILLAEQQYEEATKRAPGEAGYWVKLGQTREFRAGPPRSPAAADRDARLEEALKAFSAEGRHPDVAPLLAGRVRVLAALGRWDEALVDAEKLLVLDPADSAHWHRRADLHLQLRSWGEAAQAYRNAVGHGPTPPAVRVRHAAAAAAAGRLDDAANALSQVADTPGLRVKALAALAVAQLHRGDAAGYQKSCDRLLDLGRVAPAEFTPAARNAAAWVAALSPDPPPRLEEALALVRRVVETTPERSHRNTLAAVLIRAGKPDEAYDLLKELQADWGGRQGAPLTLAEQYHKAADHLFLVLAYRATDRYEEADRELEKARRAVETFDLALNVVPAGGVNLNDDRALDVVVAAVWYRLRLRLLLTELERPPAKKASRPRPGAAGESSLTASTR